MTTDEDPAVLFDKIKQKALSLGITPKQLASLDSVHKLQAPRWKWASVRKYVRKLLLVGTVLVVVLGIMFAIDWPISKRHAAQAWFYILDRDIERETCILEMNELVLDITRPPVNCAMCRGISQVEKVSSISPEEFEAKYAYSGTPVVIVDAMANWTATKYFSFQFFKDIYSDDSPVMNNIEANCQFFPYKTDFGSLGEVFNMSEERAQLKDGAEPWYIGW